jgi:hypothetical protein
MVDGILGYKVDTDSKTITFTFDPAMYGMKVSDIKSIWILGTFNGWKKENTDYTLTDDGNGVFTGTFGLPDNKAEFKYYINGNDWVGAKDRADGYKIPEEYGTDNLIIKY